jgi:hypothetical protein
MRRTPTDPAKAAWKPLGGACALVLASTAFVGCLMQPDVAMSVTTADGHKMEVPLSAPPGPATDGVVTVNAIQFAPWDMNADNKAKTLAFSFVIQFRPGTAPAKIVVEDDTESPILQIFEDDHPKILKENLWGGISKPFAPSDEHVNWVLNVDNNVRIYRVTVVLTDGTTHVILKPVFVPANMKAFMQKHLDLT